ncbi:MAG TPA: sugar transferase, partial [Thermoanaerobaculia bacterium]
MSSVDVGGYRVRVWEGAGLPRSIEALVAAIGLLLATPILLLCVIAIKLTSRGPVFFRQGRVGRRGEFFELYKLRTMRVQPSSWGLNVTARDDDRITPVGRILRTMKLDEIPGLWSVLVGDLSLVGPRPEVPRFVDLGNPLWREALKVRPGLTDPVTLRLRNEEELLASVGGNREAFYREVLQP